MIFEISPYVGAGKISFGMSPLQVKEILDDTPSSFLKVTSDSTSSEHYERESLFIYYKEPLMVEAIEFYSPANIVFKYKRLLELSYTELKGFLLNLDPELEIEADSLTSYKLGIGAYTSNADEDTSLSVESIIVFEKDYYEL